MSDTPYLRYVDQNSLLPVQGRPTERNQWVGFPGATKLTNDGARPGDRRLSPLDLSEILASDNYELALVPRAHITREGTRHPTVISAFLLHLSWKELVARVGEFFRHSDSSPEYRIARFEDVCVDLATMEVRRSSGQSITLTVQEFKTLRCFLSNPGRVFSRAELLTEAWGYLNYPSTRTVDNHVLKLRQKLERDPANPVHFRTIYKVGYKFVP